MKKLIQENIIFIFLVVAVVFGGIYFVYQNATLAIDSWKQAISKKDELKEKQTRLDQIKAEKASKKNVKQKSTKSGKVIYEVLGQQFSAEASFGIMFENILANITNSGLRIRSIDYNYSPTDDKVLSANAPGYNACELSFVAVGNYSQLQTFFKSIAKENYLSGINEIYLEPFDGDKSILIAKFKVRLYTKTV